MNLFRRHLEEVDFGWVLSRSHFHPELYSFSVIAPDVQALVCIVSPWWLDHHISSPLNAINTIEFLQYVNMLQRKKHLGHQASSVRSAKSSPAVFTSSWTEASRRSLPLRLSAFPAFPASSAYQLRMLLLEHLETTCSKYTQVPYQHHPASKCVAFVPP